MTKRIVLLLTSFLLLTVAALGQSSNGHGSGGGGAGFGCSGSLNNLTCNSVATNNPNGGVVFTEGSCGNVTPAIGLIVICAESTLGPLGVDALVQNVDNTGWTFLGSVPAGSTGDLQMKNGGGLSASHFNDSGTSIAASEQVALVNGTASVPGLKLSSTLAWGLFSAGTGMPFSGYSSCLSAAGDTCDAVVGDNGFTLNQSGVFAINSLSTTDARTFDTGLSVFTAGLWEGGNGTAHDQSGGFIGKKGIGVVLVSTAAIGIFSPVKADTANANQVVITTTTDTAAGLVIGICAATPGAGGNCPVQTTGYFALTLGTGTCSIGNFVIVDTTTNGRVKCTATYTAGTVIGVAMAANSTVGTTFNVMVGLR